MRVGVIGGVKSSKILIDKLFENNFNEVHVWGYHPQKIEDVSGWCNLEKISNEYDYTHSSFEKIVECELQIREYNPQILFVVGLSQIVPREILNIPVLGSIGFHPTSLPKGRGRAPIAWMILNESRGAATFFVLREGVDDGPIVAQEFFDVAPNDDASSIQEKILMAERTALDSFLGSLKQGKIINKEQDHSIASWYGRRSPEDGWIEWANSANVIEKLIRASTEPHPGAYTYCDEVKIKIWKAQVINEPYLGVTGRIMRVENNHFIIQTGNGLLEISKWTSLTDWQPRVGVRLGYYVESEVYKLRALCKSLQARVSEMEKLISKL
jgi:methionyl-tRNA formyltransferase